MGTYGFANDISQIKNESNHYKLVASHHLSTFLLISDRPSILQQMLCICITVKEEKIEIDEY